MQRFKAIKLLPSIQILFLSIGVAFTFWNDSPVVFGDTSRYWSAAGHSFGSIADFGQHSGSIVPVLLLAIARNVWQAQFIILVLWWCGGLIVLWMINTGPQKRPNKVLCGWVFLVLYVSPIFLSWQSAILAEPISLTFLTLHCMTAGSIYVLRDTRHSVFAIFVWSSLALVLSKPNWIVVCIPFLIFVALRQRKIGRITVVALPLFVALILNTFAMGKEYVGGLTYHGWYSFTQTIDLGQFQKFEDLIDPQFKLCGEGAQFLKDARAIGFELGLPTSYPRVLKRCPDLTRSLNSNPSPVSKAVRWGRSELLATVFQQSEAIKRPAIYPVTLTKTADPFFAPAIQLIVGKENDRYVHITFWVLLYLLLSRQIKRILLLVLTSGYLTFAAGILSILDGLEKHRHVLPASTALLLMAIIALLTPESADFSKENCSGGRLNPPNQSHKVVRD